MFALMFKLNANEPNGLPWKSVTMFHPRDIVAFACLRCNRMQVDALDCVRLKYARDISDTRCDLIIQTLLACVQLRIKSNLYGV